MTARILRWDIPVDDREHQIGTGRVVHAVALRHDTVTVWTVEHDLGEDLDMDIETYPTLVRVVGTGQEWDSWMWDHQSTAPHHVSGLVWHVLTRSDRDRPIRAVERVGADL